MFLCLLILLDLEPPLSSVKFSDLGGCEETIEQVCKLLVHMKHPEVFRTLGITPPRGFLLHGPPGCGKTLLSHAIAGVGPNFIVVSLEYSRAIICYCDDDDDENDDNLYFHTIMFKAE